MSKFRFLIKNSSWFFAVNSSGKLIHFLLLPLYTTYLSPQDYGIIAICLTVGGVISAFSDLGLESFASRIMFRFHDKRNRLSVLLGNIYLYSISLMILTSLTLSIFPGTIRHLFFSNSKLPAAAIVLIPIWQILFMKISGLLQSYQRIKQLGRQYFTINITRVIFLHSLKISALIVFKFGVIGFLLAELITDALIAITSILLLWYMIRPKFNLRKKRIIKMGFRFSIPFVPEDLGGWIIKYFDRILLLRMIDMWNVGLYSFASSFAGLLNFMWYPFRQGVTPEIIKRLDNKNKYRNAEKNFVEYIYCFILLGSGGFLIITLFVKEIGSLISNERFHSSFILVPIFVISLILQNMRELFEIPITLKYKTWFHPINTYTSAFINITLNLIFIPLWGTTGAALSGTLTNVTRLLISLIYSQRIMYIAYNYMICALPLIIATICYLSVNIIFSFSRLLYLKLAVLVIYGIFSLFFLKRYCPVVWKHNVETSKKIAQSFRSLINKERTFP